MSWVSNTACSKEFSTPPPAVAAAAAADPDSAAFCCCLLLHADVGMGLFDVKGEVPSDARLAEMGIEVFDLPEDSPLNAVGLLFQQQQQI